MDSKTTTVFYLSVMLYDFSLTVHPSYSTGPLRVPNRIVYSKTIPVWCSAMYPRSAVMPTALPFNELTPKGSQQKISTADRRQQILAIFPSWPFNRRDTFPAICQLLLSAQFSQELNKHSRLHCALFSDVCEYLLK